MIKEYCTCQVSVFSHNFLGYTVKNGGSSGAVGQQTESYTVKKRLAVFPSPAGMSLTKLSLAGDNLIFSDQGECDKLHPGWGRENR
jgi:hypothetical protein